MINFFNNEADLVKVGANDAQVLNSIIFGVANPKNRQLNANHIKECESGILNGAFMHDVIVNRRSGVCLDGNHTLTAFRNLWRDGKAQDKYFYIRFIDIDEEKELETILDLNNHQKTWQLWEVVVKNMDAKEDYKKIVNFCLEDKFTIDSRTGNGKLKYFESLYGCSWGAIKKGNLVIDDVKLKEARVIRNEIKKIFDAFGYEYTGEWVTPFIDAWRIERETTTVDKFIKKGLRTWNNNRKIQHVECFNTVNDSRKKNKRAWQDYICMVNGSLRKAC